MLRDLDAGIRREGENLVVSGVKGSISAELAQEIRNNQPDILALLDQASNPVSSTDQIAAIDRNRDLPLGLTQWRFWYLANLAPQSAIYNLPAAFNLSGVLKPDVLEAALGFIIQRHEILRTRIVMRNYEPTQEILPAVEFNLELVDLSELASAHQQTEMLRRIDEERDIPISMSDAPMLRSALYRLSPTEHVLFWMPHHVIWDGWSFDLLLKELDEIYSELEQGREPAITPLSIQYADYTCWHRKLMEGDKFEQQLAFWKTQLSGELPVLQLPTDRPRPAMMSFEGARRKLQIDETIIKRLNRLARDEGATLFMVLLAGLYVFLYRYTGQKDLIVGSPVQSRMNDDTENLIGVFVNTLVLRAKLQPEMTFRELIRMVKHTCISNYDYQDTPFEKLVDEFESERTLDRNPLYQVLFSYQDVTNRDPQVGSLKLSQTHIETSVAPTDLTIWVMETGHGLEGGIDYATDLFDGSTVDSMITHYLQLLASGADNPETAVGHLPMLSRDEQLVQVERAAGRKLAFPDYAVETLIEAIAASNPNAAAICCDGKTLTYQQLLQESNLLASALQHRGIKPGDLVGVCVHRGISLLPLLLGIFKSGAAYVPLDPDFPVNRLEYMIDDAGLNLIVTEKELRARLTVIENTSYCDLPDLYAVVPLNGASGQKPILPANRLAYVIYTSGSTGKPKGVEIPQSAVVNLLLSFKDALEIGKTDKLLAVTTLSFDISVLELFLPLLSGATLLLANSATTQDAHTLRKLLEQESPTIMQATPATWRMLKDAGWKGSDALTALCGGEEMPRDIATWLVDHCRRLANVYGPTETTVWSSLHWVSKEEPSQSAISIGKPIANTQMYVLDEQYNLLPSQVPGDLYIAGEGLACGYRNLPEMTAEKFVRVPILDQAILMYKTGDRASHRNEGLLDFYGRTDQQVKVRGYRIELGDVEAALVQVTEIREAVAAVQHLNQVDARLVAFVVFERDADVTTTEIRKSLRKTLPDYMIPSIFVEIDALPKTPNGKVDRRALPDAAQNLVVTGNVFRDANTKEEEIISGLWKELLIVEKINMNDNFFDLGGSSLLAVRCVAKVEENTGIKINPRELFFRSAAQLAELIR